MPNARAPGRGGGLPPLPELPLWAEPMGGGGIKLLMCEMDHMVPPGEREPERP